MRVIHQHGNIADLDEIQASRRLGRAGVERRQPDAQIFQRNTVHKTREGRRQHILDHKLGAPAVGQRDIERFFDPDLPLALQNRDIPILINARNAPAARLALDIRVIFIHREKHDVPFHPFLHLVNEIVLGIQDRETALRNRPRYHRFNARKVFERVDVLEAEMIGGNIRHDADIAIIKAQARPDNAARARSRARPHRPSGLSAQAGPKPGRCYRRSRSAGSGYTFRRSS